MQKEIQKLTLVEAREEYVFEYVYPPLVMERKSEPNRILILILFFIIGAFSGSIIAFFKHYFSEEKNDMDRIES